MLVKSFSSAVSGVEAHTITIEVSAGGTVTTGKNFYFVVGLPDNAIKEGFQRIETAIKQCKLRMPRIKIVVNLAPADIRKEGSAYDLPIALGILAATNQIDHEDLDKYIVMGELSLDGGLRPIRGALPIAIQARKEGYKGMIIPIQNAKEAAIVNNLDVYGVKSLCEVVDFLNKKIELQPTQVDTRGIFECKEKREYAVDFSDVKGQENIKRALEIAAAGGHNVILVGPPGAGKTMLARRLPSILPPLNLREALETTKIHSVAGLLKEHKALIPTRPFRSPHHTISDVALVGGGSNPHPGEISLAHNGVLFLDELPEFKRSVLEVLRQPMEEREITISRARLTVKFPAGFMLISSMNPCPCGYHNHPAKDCVCGPGVVKRYLNKISGPLLDRIDLHVEVTPVSYQELSDNDYQAEKSDIIMDRVIKARHIQEERFQHLEDIYYNAQMPGSMIKKVCTLEQTSINMLRAAMEKLQLSARAYDRILKVARTIADLDVSSNISPAHIAEAINYRSLDRGDWAD